MTPPVLNAIASADAARLAELVEHDPRAAREPVPLGDGSHNRVPPLHLVCDVLFRRLVDQDEALALAEVLLAAGVDVNEAYAKSGDSFLIAAASLGAEKVGLRLLEAGASVEPRGLFGATALHWSVMMGLPELSDALAAAGAELELRDERYSCTPIEWGLHAWTTESNGYRDQIPAACSRLVARGARVPPNAAAQLPGASDVDLRNALGL